MVSPTNDTAYVVMASHNNIPDHERRGEQGGERIGDGVPGDEPPTTIPKPPGQYQHQQHHGSTSPTTTTMAAGSREPLQCCDLRRLLLVLNSLMIVLVLLAVVCLLLDKDQDFLEFQNRIVSSSFTMVLVICSMAVRSKKKSHTNKTDRVRDSHTCSLVIFVFFSQVLVALSGIYSALQVDPTTSTLCTGSGYLVLAVLSRTDLFLLLAIVHGWFWWKHSDSEEARENPTPMNLSI